MWRVITVVKNLLALTNAVIAEDSKSPIAVLLDSYAGEGFLPSIHSPYDW